MNGSLPDWVWDYVPHWATITAIALALMAYIVAKIAHSREGIEKLWSKVSAWFNTHSKANEIRNRDVDYQIEDLWRQVQFLEEQLAELRLRDEMYWAWILTDQEWHRQHEFAAAEKGYDTVPHKSFMDFRDEWLSNRSTRRIRKAKTSEGVLPF